MESKGKYVWDPDKQAWVRPSEAKSKEAAGTLGQPAAEAAAASAPKAAKAKAASEARPAESTFEAKAEPVEEEGEFIELPYITAPVRLLAFIIDAALWGFILWIILMVKAYNGEKYKLPWAGNLAENMVAKSGVTDEHDKPPTPPPAEPPSETPQPPRAEAGKQAGDKAGQFFESTRGGRITASAFAIAWSIILLIFFNFFNHYVAYYHSETADGVTTWTRYPFFTEDINLWLPVLTTALILTILGHIILIIFDSYTLREIVLIILDALGLTVVLTLLSVFPFDFSVIPNTTAADVAYSGVKILLILNSIGIGIGILVRLIKLIVHTARQVTS